MNERPTWADTRPWEKYPADVTAEITIKGPDEDIHLVDVTPERAHAELLRAYLTAQDKVTGDTGPDFFIECLDQAARSEGFGGMSGHGFDVTVYYRRPHVALDEKQTCPRRMGEMGPWEYKENLDSWEKVGDWRCCSFCGSMHPDDVIEAVKKLGPGIVETCDKSYKRYIKLPNTPNASFGPIKFYVMHFTEEQRERFNALVTGGKE